MIPNHGSGIFLRRVMETKTTGRCEMVFEESRVGAEVPFSSLLQWPVTSVCLQGLRFVR